MTSDPHPSLGRLVWWKSPKGAELHGQVIDHRAGRLLVKPNSNEKPFWTDPDKVRPEWVDHISKQLRHL